MYKVNFQYPGKGRKLSRETWLYADTTNEKQTFDLATKELAAKYKWHKILSIEEAK